MGTKASINASGTSPIVVHDDFCNERDVVNRALTRWWLYLVCLFVVVIVIVGGATRLTGSGLSITEWKPLLGVLPPLSHSDWLAEFENYKQIPQYIQINNGMNLSEFQFIYWWEWGHRFLGRVVGVVFVIPLIFLYMTKQLESGLKLRLSVLFALGVFQSFVGWWMVSSGLTERASVSQYRLATHLVIACLIFSYALWVALGLAPRRPHNHEPSPKIIHILATIIILFVFLQIFLGALVAGLDAGFAFNDWPLMDGSIIPDSLFVIEPGWLNFFENSKMVQFIHRTGAYALTLLIVTNLIVVLRLAPSQGSLKRSIIMTLIVLAQVALGIITLVLQTPLNWALLHQTGAIVLLGFSIFHWQALAGERYEWKNGLRAEA